MRKICKTCRWYVEEICCNKYSDRNAEIREDHDSCEMWQREEIEISHVGYTPEQMGYDK